MTNDEALALALKEVERDTLGHCRETDLRDLLKQHLKAAFDIDLALDHEVDLIIKKATKASPQWDKNVSFGQLAFPDWDGPPIPYDPNRLVRGVDKNLIEQRCALTEDMRAEAMRSRKNRGRVDKRDDLTQDIVLMFMAWEADQLENKRPRAECIWDTWVREAGIWSAEEAPAPDPTDEEE